jgi:hypothetical protein
MQIIVEDSVKARLAKASYSIPNKLLQEEEAAKRKSMTDEELIRIFDLVWIKYLNSAVETSDNCEIMEVRKKLPKRYEYYIDDNQEHRTFRLQEFNLDFIAQLKRLSDQKHELTQLWFIESRDYSPTCIPIYFANIEEKNHFKRIADELYWDASELALELIRDFMKKVGRRF